MPITKDDAALGAVYFEFTPIGHSLKVVAIHGATGLEVSAVAPASAARADLQRLALQKLKARLRSDQQP
jgi:hypothetical protein